MLQLTERQVQIWIGGEPNLSLALHNLKTAQPVVWIGNQLPPFLNLPFFSFSKAKNLLGQEFTLIIYDAREGLNLDALAITSGTLHQNGLLILLFPQWENLTKWQDPDSLRWSGENQPILTPHFLRYFQQKVRKYSFPIYHTSFPPLKLPNNLKSAVNIAPKPTTEQNEILRAINNATEDILLVTAKRGRGKSALAGFWAKQLIQQHRYLLLTAPNKSAVNILQQFAGTTLNFMPPDVLYSQIEQNPEQFAQTYLLIDEAAMLPLTLLNAFTSAFQKVLCTTTTQSYEGTGRGFLLKFKANLHRTFRHFELHQPLRWQANDKLEIFIDELLLLNAEDKRLPQQDQQPILLQAYSQTELVQQHKIAKFYGLLTLAHYRTSPLDLRRLFDAPKQHFYLAETPTQIIGGAWLVEEGKIQSEQLITDIARGLRRPRGNLVAQLLCFHGNLRQACRLSSLRISRIAIQPNYQQQSIGQKLISRISQQAQVDFLSVSFGYTEKLAAFWQKCGFIFVHLSEQKEASSGCYSLIGLKPLTTQGKQFCQQAQQQFQHNLWLSFHPLGVEKCFQPMEANWQFSPQDREILQNFAYYHASLYASTPAILRLERLLPEQAVSPLKTFAKALNHNQCRKKIEKIHRTLSKKEQLKIYREDVKKWLQKLDEIL